VRTGPLTRDQGDRIIGLLEQVRDVAGQQGTKFAGVLNNTASGAGMRGSYSTRR
jgi:hypothetical protein